MNSTSSPIEAACLILAGGEGKRLTPHKPLLSVGGKPIIERIISALKDTFQELILVSNDPDVYGWLGVRVVSDLGKGYGPLMGIYSGLLAISYDLAFVCAADMPFLSPRLIRAMYEETADCDVVVPSPDGKSEFLHAFYKKSCAPKIKRNLDSGFLKISMIEAVCNVKYLKSNWFSERGLEAVAKKAFININTKRDYERLKGSV